MKLILCIAAGGALGAVSRYGLGRWITSICPGAFPWGTMCVNLLGCLLIGLLYGLFDRHCALTAEARAFLTVGFCGGFTTFSTFIHENHQLLSRGDTSGLFLAALYCVVSITGGLLLAHLGHSAAKYVG